MAESMRSYRPTTVTTHEVGKICGVFHTTVTAWTNKGLLKARRTPGGHRRIDLQDLLAFMRQHQIPIPSYLLDQKKALVIIRDAALRKTVCEALEQLRFQEISAHQGAEGFLTIGEKRPDLLILDWDVPKLDVVGTCRALRSNPGTGLIRIVAIGRKVTQKRQGSLQYQADARLARPVSVGDVEEQVKIVCGL